MSQLTSTTSRFNMNTASYIAGFRCDLTRDALVQRRVLVFVPMILVVLTIGYVFQHVTSRWRYVWLAIGIVLVPVVLGVSYFTILPWGCALWDAS